MTPTPQEHGLGRQAASSAPAPSAPGEMVVISGMAGLYPQSRYVKDLENILYNKLNPVSSEHLRWVYSHPEVAQFAGNVPDLDRFDAQFFKVHYRLGNNMDSMSRKILEQTYEAIYDAGLSPEHISDKKVGVYIGTCFSETEKACFYVASSRTGFGIAGCSKAMFANRISYWLNAKGPSMSIDEACCSSAAALEQAYLAISRGECEAAVVGGAYLCLHPQSSVHYGRTMEISMDGKTKSFAEDAAGCAKSEAINVLFLQKAKHAKRIYAHVVHVKGEFVSVPKGEIGPMYGFYREPSVTVDFLKNFYKDAGIQPSAVEYVEAFGSAVPEADKSELEAIDKIFCTKREQPLLVGSVMSNIGYGEAASGISAVTKVLLGYHNGELAGNLHCDVPRRDVAAIQDGRIRILTENERFHRTYAAVNTMSVTGVNVHILLHGHYKPKDKDRYKTNIPRLVTISTRQDSSVKRVLDYLKSKPIDPEELALLHNIHETRIAGHLGRGFTILDTNAEQKTVSLAEGAEYCDDVQRPLWFVYSGMGSQWAGMGAQLMRIPVFAAAIERCRRVLEPKGIDIVHIITSPDKTIYDNILHSFVGIAAVQIGLTDVLFELGLIPDKIIGHSVGELGCAYADGSLTAEEMILSAYSRGRVSVETPLIRGSMAAIGMGFQQMSQMCPPEIEIACHNSADSCTISGPAEVMRSFVADLTAKNIFAKEVPCSNIAYHSRYIAEAGPGLLKYLKEVIKTPRARSERWVSTSVPQDKWEESIAKYSSAEYHTNNLLSPVLFEETSKLIPSNAVLVEVAPHGLLQAILKRSLPETCTNIPLTRRGHPDNVVMVLEAIGKLYMIGYNPRVQKLYPKVEFPVSTGTPFLSHLVDWAHHEIWSLPLFQSAHRSVSSSCTYKITLHDDDYSYIKGHVIKRKTLVPFSLALVATWDTLAMSMNAPKKSMNVEFRDVRLYAQPTLSEQKQVKLSIALHRGTGWFEVMNETAKVATGYITALQTKRAALQKFPVNCDLKKEDYKLSASDVYHLLYERGYGYCNAFRTVESASETLNEAKIVWENNWVTFIDGLLQLNMLNHTHNGVSLPEQIGRIVINLDEHSKTIQVENDKNKKEKVLLTAQLSNVQKRTRSGGVLLENIRLHDVLPMNADQITMQTLKFVPRFSTKYDVTTSLYIFLQIVAENVNKDEINVVGYTQGNNHSHIFETIQKIAQDNSLPDIKVNYRHIQNISYTGNETVYQNVDLVVVRNISNNDTMCQHFHRMLRTNTFIVNEEGADEPTRVRPYNLYNVVSVLKNQKSQLELLCWRPIPPTAMGSSFTVRSESHLPLLKNVREQLSPLNSLMVLSSYPPIPGLESLVKQWRKESIRNRIHLIMINENSNESLGVDELPNMNLAYNVFHDGLWGGEYYLPLREVAPCKDGDNMKLQINVFGNLDSLQWVQAPEQTEPGTSVTVHYAGINVGDVKRALGVIALTKDSGNNFGMEFSGITQRGERVMGIVQKGAASTQVIAQPELMWPVPSHWTLEEAATVPFAYMYAYYCMVLKSTCRLIIKKKEDQYTVLVHGGAGALGQAVINVALAKGYRVFTTVSDLHKKRFLLKLFPKLRAEDIGNSRDSSFGDLVLSATNGQGCNMIISCVKKDLKDITLKCCAKSSTVCDTVQVLNNENYMFGMYHLTQERSYVAVDINTIFKNPTSEETKQLHRLVSEGIARGDVVPLTRVTFAAQEAARAFRLLAASRHRGRALLRLRDPPPCAKPRIPCVADRCHVILCDRQPLGIQLAEKLIEHGVRLIHLHMQNQPSYIQYKLRSWETLDVKVSISSGELNDIDDVTRLFHNATRLGAIEGIYMIAENMLQENISNLDLVSRDLCPYLKHFLIIHNDYPHGYYTSVQRVKNGLPATILDISKLDTIQDADGCTWYLGAVEAVERALLSADPVLFAQQQSTPRSSLVQQITDIIDLKVTDNNIPINASLEELGMVLEKSSAVSAFLRDNHNIFLEEDAIPSLTIESINQIDDGITNTKFKDVKGLETFYSYVDEDELMATTDIVYLPTLANNATMRGDESDVEDTFLCIVPGLEGHHARFSELCENLKLPALVLQPGLDHPGETPHQLALRYSKNLLKKTRINKNFYILGYEMGIIVALELAAILEENGLSGTVFCIGEGPEEMKLLLEEELAQYENEETLQTSVLNHMFSMMAGDKSALASAAAAGRPWREQVDVCLRALLGRMSHSAQYTRALVEAAYTRIETARRYSVPAEPRVLRARLVLLRARHSGLAAPADCSLQRYSHDTIVVQDLATPMRHAAADRSVPALINRYLDPALLEAFDKKNLCDTYVINDALMMQSTQENK